MPYVGIGLVGWVFTKEGKTVHFVYSQRDNKYYIKTIWRFLSSCQISTNPSILCDNRWCLWIAA